MKKLKKLTSISLAVLMILNTFLPITVLALDTTNGIVLSFSVTHQGHSMEKRNDNYLYIDGNKIEPTDENLEVDNDYVVACGNNTCTMSFDNAVTSVSLQLGGIDAFTLRAQGQVMNNETVLTQSEAISIEDPYNPNQNNNNNNNQSQPYTYDESKLSFTLTFNISNSAPQNFEFVTNEINTQLKVTNGERDTFLGIEDNAHQGVSESHIYVTVSQDKKSATVKIYEQDAGVMLSTPGDGLFEIDNYSGAMNLVTTNQTFSIIEKEAQEPFDGKVLLIWQCGEEACKHEFTLAEPQTMSYFLDSDIADKDDSTRKFDLKKALNGEIKAGYALPSDLEAWETEYSGTNSNYNFRTVDLDLLLDGRMREIEQQYLDAGTCEYTGVPGEFEQCVDEHAHPTIVDRGISGRISNGQEMGNNSHIAYGDNMFKITIYTEDYVGLKEDESTYNYRRERFETMYSESKDISESTKENPYILDTLLIEGKTVISSNGLNGVEFKEIKALDVPEGAVTITKISDGKFKIEFNSNFYDRTIFEITDTNNNKYYVRMVRSIIEISVHNGNPVINKNNTYVEVDLLFDDRQSWDDYEVNATIAFKDGTYKKQALTNLRAIDKGGANVYYVEEVQFGEHLKTAAFGLDLDGDEHYFESIDGIYINVRKSGSTEDTYAGTYAGNGRGLFITGSDEGPIVDYSK